MILAKGTETGFSDKHGKPIKVGDCIKSAVDGSVLTVDKFSMGVSRLGFKYGLAKLQPIHRGQNENGTYFARLTVWEITSEEPQPVEVESVHPGDDTDNIAPTRVRDPRNTNLKKENWHKESVAEMEAEAVKNGVTVEEAKAILKKQSKPEKADRGLSAFTDDEIAAELKRRGWRGVLKKSSRVQI